MRIRLIFLVLFIVLINQDLFADSFDKSNTDSTLSSLDDYSIDYLLNISREIQIQNFDSAESILLTANHLADSLRETESQIKASILLGHLYFDNGYFEDAEDIFNEILNKFSTDLSDEQLADVKHSLGLNHIRFNNYDKAINLFQEALLYYEKASNKAEIARALKDIGAVYYYLGNENSALDNYQKALLIYKEINDSDGIARSYNNIGMIFKDKGNIQLSLEYLNRSLEIKKNQGNQYGIANTLGNIGDSYMTNNQHDKAIGFFKEALALWLDLDYLHGITEVYNYLGEVYIKKLSQEHGIINAPNKFVSSVKIGDLLYIIPVHSCLTANLMKNSAIYE